MVTPLKVIRLIAYWDTGTRLNYWLMSDGNIWAGQFKPTDNLGTYPDFLAHGFRYTWSEYSDFIVQTHKGD